MLGTFRFALACFVVMFHIGSFPLPFGTYSVQCFYVVSGYLITAVLNESYASRPAAFWINRFLRLYPQYYAVAAISLLAIVLLPKAAASYHSVWVVDTSPISIASQIAIFPFAVASPAMRLVPPVWSVAIELINYFILWIFAARSWRHASVAFGAGLAIHAYLLCAELDWGARYFFWYAAILPFAIGSLAYFGRTILLRTRTRAIACTLWVCNLAAASWITSYLHAPMFWYTTVLWYANMIFAAFIVVHFAAKRKAPLADRWLGDLAYPIFLSHWTLSFLVATWFAIAPHSLRLLLASAVPILLFSTLLAYGSRAIIDRYRDKIRAGISTDRSDAEQVVMLTSQR
ncbi:MAG: acyltransferase [Dokdonella sp.]